MVVDYSSDTLANIRSAVLSGFRGIEVFAVTAPLNDAGTWEPSLVLRMEAVALLGPETLRHVKPAPVSPVQILMRTYELPVCPSCLSLEDRLMTSWKC
jgi:hypothetical protein